MTILPPPISTLFPYTTLFRSDQVYAQNEMLAYQQKESTARVDKQASDRKSGSAGMPRPISYAVFCLKKKYAPRRRNGAPASCSAYEILILARSRNTARIVKHS